MPKKNYDKVDGEEFQKAFEEGFDQAKIDFDKIVKQKLIIALYGDVNSGKSSTINKLTGRDEASVRSKIGWTKEVILHQYAENVFFADTPGLNDPNIEVSKRTDVFVESSADVILFFFKATGFNDYDIKAFSNIKKSGKPIIPVLNYIDIWYKDDELEDKLDHDEFIQQLEEKIEAKVIPISAKREINIDLLNSKILHLVQTDGKDLLYLKVSKYKDNQVKIWINGASITAAGIGAIPFPGADIVPLTTLQVGLALKIAYIYNCVVSRGDVMKLIASTITGSIGKQIYKFAIQLLKALGWLGGPFGEGAVMAVAAAVAASMTYGFGWACNAYYKSGMTMDLGTFGEIFSQMQNEHFQQNRS